MRCGACGATMAPTFRRRLLSQGQVQYFECRSCGFTRTEDPTWLAEAYSRPISRLDTGAVARNLSCARDLRLLLPRWFGWGGRYLDFAGGHGVLTRLMRDHGLDYYWADRYADNLFAGGFEWSTGLSPATAVSAVEVLEHVVRPDDFLAEVLRTSGAETVMMTTLLRPQGSLPADWWYLAPETGQHVAFHTPESLRRLGRRFGMDTFSIGQWHVLTRRQLPHRAALSLLLKVRSRGFSQRRSRSWADHLLLRETNGTG